MIRFRFDPTSDEGYAFEHFTLEGDNAAGFVLLGYSSGQVQAPSGEAFEGEEDFDESGEGEMFQRWFDTVGAALKCAENDLGIPRAAWVAPIMKTHSGRLVPPMPQAPQKRTGMPDEGSRPEPRIGGAPISLSDAKTDPPPTDS